MSGIIAAANNTNGAIINGSSSNSTGQKIDLNIEAPFVKIVHECIVKSNNFAYIISIIAFKSHKKFIEKEVNLIVTKINTIKKQGSSKGA